MVLGYLTPSFHPAIGMKPSTDTVMMMIVKVAKIPVIKLWVAIIRIGKAIHIPITTPLTADWTKT